MKKFIFLIALGLLLISAEYGLAGQIQFHDYYQILVLFFVVQTAVLFRVEAFGTEETKVQMRMVSMGLRMVSALVFVLVMSQQVKSDSNLFYLQFIILYLVFMAFEIILALANLRRN